MCRYLLYWAVAAPFFLYSNPKQPQVVHGEVSIESSSPHHMVIHANDKAVIHWDKFSIGPGELTQFVQPSFQSTVLNKVANGVSTLEGALQANGKVFLINPQGIIIGKDALINTAGFIASSLDLMEEDFLAGKDLCFKGEGIGSVENYGRIQAVDGDALLIGYRVVDQGVMEAPQGVAGLAAGLEVLVKPMGEERIFIRTTSGPKAEVGVDHKGLLQGVQAEIKADGGLYSLAIRSEGQVSATGVERRDGKVFLVSHEGYAEVSGQMAAENIRILAKDIEVKEGAVLDASGENRGGSIWIGGDRRGMNPEIPHADTVVIHKGANLRADALERGDGGEVIVFANGATFYHGDTSAQGGKESGNGGFVEVSGKKYLDITGGVTALAPNGKSGKLLIDPENIDITAVDLNNTATACGPPRTITWNTVGNTVTINAATIVGFLATCDVTIDASDQGNYPGLTAPPNMQVGNITVSNPIVWTGSHILTLNAGGAITVNAPITLTLATLPDFIPFIELNANYDININAPLSVTAAVLGSFPAGLDVIILRSENGNVNISDTIIIDSGEILIEAFNFPFFSADRNIQVGGNINIGANVGSYFGPGNILLDAVGDITVGVTQLGMTVQNVEVFAINGDISAVCQGNFSVLGQNNILGLGFHSLVGANLDTLISLNFPGAPPTAITTSIEITAANAYLTAGTGISGTNFAQIGISGGSTSTMSPTLTGTADIEVTKGAMVLLGSTGLNGYAQFGITPCTTRATTIVADGYNVSAGTVIALLGGGALDNYALIGHGGVATTGTMTFAPMSQTSISTRSASLNVQGGTQNGCFAAIGIAGTPLANFTGDVGIDASGPIPGGAFPFNDLISAPVFTLTGSAMHGDNDGAYFGIFLYGALPMGTPGSITMNPAAALSFSMGLSGSGGGGKLSLLGGAAPTSPAAIGIGNSLVSGNNINGTIDLSVVGLLAGDVILDGTNGIAFIQDGTGTPPPPTGSVTTTITTENLTISGGGVGGGPAFINSIEGIEVDAGLNITLTAGTLNNAYIQAANNITLVTDNDFPNRPQIFFTGFSLDANSFISITDGFDPISIYTARFPQNTILGKLNGASFTGTRFVNDAQNQYGVYFGDFVSANFPYTIFYKEGEPIIPPPPPPGSSSSSVAAAVRPEFFLEFEFQPFQLPEERLYWEPPFDIRYNDFVAASKLYDWPEQIIWNLLKLWINPINDPAKAKIYSSYVFAQTEKFFLHKYKYIYYKGY